MALKSCLLQIPNYTKNLHIQELNEFFLWILKVSEKEGFLALEDLCESSVEYQNVINIYQVYSGYIKVLLHNIGVATLEDPSIYENVFYFIVNQNEKPDCILIIDFLLHLYAGSVDAFYMSSLGMSL